MVNFLFFICIQYYNIAFKKCLLSSLTFYWNIVLEEGAWSFILFKWQINVSKNVLKLMAQYSHNTLIFIVSRGDPWHLRDATLLLCFRNTCLMRTIQTQSPPWARKTAPSSCPCRTRTSARGTVVIRRTRPELRTRRTRICSNRPWPKSDSWDRDRPRTISTLLNRDTTETWDLPYYTSDSQPIGTMHGGIKTVLKLLCIYFAKLN